MRAVDLKALAKERGLRGYSRLKKAELIALLRELRARPPPILTPRPIPDPSPPPPRPIPAPRPPRTRPPRPNRPPPPPPPSVRFRPDRPRQPELLRKLEERNPQPLQPPTLKPYQLKTKRGKETFIESPMEQKESPPTNPKKLKRMNKKLSELNRKIRHSRKKHDGLIHKRNSLKEAIKGLKRLASGGNRKPTIEHEQGFIEARSVPFTECEQAFGGAYRSYRVNSRPKMDVDTFFNRIRGDLIDLIKRELTDLNSARVQTTTWIRFIKDDDRVELSFNSRMMDVHLGSNLDAIVDGMIAHMKTQIENPALLNSRFRFDEVLFLDVNFHQLNHTRGGSYLLLPDWIARKKAVINPRNDDEECFRWAVIAALEIGKDPQCVSNLRKFVDNYYRSGLEFPVSTKDIGVFENKNNISVNVLAVEGKDIYTHRKGWRPPQAGSDYKRD